MKLIQHWYDRYEKITNNIYTTENGMRVVESINPRSREAAVHILVKGGVAAEYQKSLPIGTAHFLEHMLCNPNDKFKDLKSLNDSTKGTLKSPAIFRNAWTGLWQINFRTICNFKGLSRSLDYLFHQVLYPLDRFEEFIENERQIILAEFYRKGKIDKDASVGYDRFFFGDIFDEVSEFVLGTDSSIREIKVKDLVDYYQSVFCVENIVLTILNPKTLNKKEKLMIEKFASKLKSGKEINIKQKEITNKFKYKAFQNDQENNVHISLNKFFKYPLQNDYPLAVRRSFLAKLLNEVSKIYLRDEKSLVYNCGGFNQNTGVFHYNLGFSTNIGFDKFPELLMHIKILLEDKVLEFLNSKDSDLWFISEQSKYIFETNEEIDMDYARGIGFNLQFQYAPEYEFTEIIDNVKKLTKKEILDFYLYWLKIPTGFWFVSNEDEKKIEEVFEKSELFSYSKK